VLAPDGSGLPLELWRGLDLKAVEELLAGLDLPPRSPAVHQLWRRLLIASAAPPVVRVLSSDQRALAGLLRSPDVTVTPADDGALMVSGLSAGQVGATAAAAGITVFQLATEQTSLEDAFVDLTKDAVEYRAATHQEEK